MQVSQPHRADLKLRGASAHDRSSRAHSRVCATTHGLAHAHYRWSPTANLMRAPVKCRLRQAHAQARGHWRALWEVRRHLSARLAFARARSRQRACASAAGREWPCEHGHAFGHAQVRLRDRAPPHLRGSALADTGARARAQTRERARARVRTRNLLLAPWRQKKEVTTRRIQH